MFGKTKEEKQISKREKRTLLAGGILCFAGWVSGVFGYTYYLKTLYPNETNFANYSIPDWLAILIIVLFLAQIPTLLLGIGAETYD